MATEQVDLDPALLKPALWNPRTMKPLNRGRLARGILEFGFVASVTARAEDLLLIGGHQRVDVALTLRADAVAGGRALPDHLGGLATVPVTLVSGLSDAKAKALAILLNNQEAAGEFSYRPLTELLSELDAEGLDATLTGYDTDALARLLTRDPAPGVSTAMPSALAAGAASGRDELLQGTSPTRSPVSCPRCHHTFLA